jgi:hypothetical protein
VEWLCKHPTRKKPRPRKYSRPSGRLLSLAEIGARIPETEPINLFVSEHYAALVPADLPAHIRLHIGFGSLNLSGNRKASSTATTVRRVKPIGTVTRQGANTAPLLTTDKGDVVAFNSDVDIAPAVKAVSTRRTAVRKVKDTSKRSTVGVTKAPVRKCAGKATASASATKINKPRVTKPKAAQLNDAVGGEGSGVQAPVRRPAAAPIAGPVVAAAATAASRAPLKRKRPAVKRRVRTTKKTAVTSSTAAVRAKSAVTTEVITVKRTITTITAEGTTSVTVDAQTIIKAAKPVKPTRTTRTTRATNSQLSSRRGTSSADVGKKGNSTPVIRKTSTRKKRSK